MINLGKVLPAILLGATTLWATFDVRVNATTIQQGDQLVVTFASDQSDDFPKVGNIGGVEIQSSAKSASTTFINGRRSAQYTQRFILTPMKSFTIPAYTMEEEGKVVRSKPVAITVVKRKQRPDSELFFDVSASKREVYVGEPFRVTLTYKQSHDLDVIDLRLVPPSGKHLWVDAKNVKEEKSKSATHDVTTLHYLFTAQKAGELTIEPAHIKVGQRSYRRDAWGMLSMTPSYKSLFSDPITIKAKPLPGGVDTIGRFTLDVRVDKRQTRPNEAVNVTVQIRGRGNIEDIPPYRLPLKDVMIYDEKPQKRVEIKGGEFEGSFEQKFALLSDHDYTIPPLEFRYFDKAKKRVVTLRSEAIAVHIEGAQKAQEANTLKIERAQARPERAAPAAESSRISWLLGTAIFSAGVIAGMVWMRIPFGRLRRPKPRKRALRSSDTKAVLQQLIAHAGHDAEARALLERMEGELYRGEDNKVTKAEIKRVIARLN